MFIKHCVPFTVLSIVIIIFISILVKSYEVDTVPFFPSSLGMLEDLTFGLLSQQCKL